MRGVQSSPLYLHSIRKTMTVNRDIILLVLFSAAFGSLVTLFVIKHQLYSLIIAIALLVGVIAIAARLKGSDKHA